MTKKVIVQVDWYTKMVLTLIAVLLAGLLAKSYVDIKEAQASLGPQEVVVVNDRLNPISVEIRETVPVGIIDTLPVEVGVVPVEIIDVHSK